MAMESSTQNLQNPHDFEWPYHEQDLLLFDKALELPPLDGFFDFNSLSLPFHLDNLSQLEAEIIFSPEKHMNTIPLPPLYDDTAAGEIKPARMTIKEEELERSGLFPFPSCCWKEEDDDEKSLRLLRNGRRKSSVLELEEIQKHFHIPISEAAKEMNVGLTVLKKRCRQLNIMRWPHRKLKSLKSLIKNVQEMGLTNEIKGLEEHKRLVEELPDMDLTHRTKRLRQACFKAKYKKKIRRSNINAALH